MTVQLPAFPPPPPERRVFCNRTLNLRRISVVGLDMDYTLVHYRTDEWERSAFEHAKRLLLADGWPVEELAYDDKAFTLGLVVDVLLGNIVKANRFGFVKLAAHGRTMIDFGAQKEIYVRDQVDLSESRWRFMNTLFSLSEACLYAGLVELADAGKLPRPVGYEELYRLVKAKLDETHMEGALKQEIIREPERFVVLDEELPLALLDLKQSGKRLAIITNSEWSYTEAMMSYAFDRYLPGDMDWRSLFDAVFVSARKPEFFSRQQPAFEVLPDGLLRPHVGPLTTRKVYWGGDARMVEQLFECRGDEILYVGDHIFTDVHVTKDLLRWRTALVARELELELEELEEFRGKQRRLDELMQRKEELEYQFSRLRLVLQRAEGGYGPPSSVSPDQARRRLHELRVSLREVDSRIGPLATEASRLVNERWGPLLRAGNDRSHLARQIERRADIYTSRVSNLLLATPFVFIRSPRGSLPHDPPPIL
jgi:HAD superfamily 5'-nucleotidase-like hydrolase